jgi:hypothetical protein
MTKYVATINTPGYLPDSDEAPPTFDTPAEAWSYLAQEREDAESEAAEDDSFVASDCLIHLRDVAERAEVKSIYVPEVTTGTIYGDTPGYEGDHDLGLAYSVEVAEEEE